LTDGGSGLPIHINHVELFFAASIAFGNEFVELLGLLVDALGGPLFILGARRSRRLLGKLPKVVSQDRDAIVEFGER
jgi:hypothetical protein